MKLKPIVTTCHVVAAFDGPVPRYLCRDTKHGHWVVTTDQQKASQFATGAEALAAAADYLRLGFGLHHTRPADWKAYAVTTRTTFVEMVAEPA